MVLQRKIDEAKLGALQLEASEAAMQDEVRACCLPACCFSPST